MKRAKRGIHHDVLWCYTVFRMSDRIRSNIEHRFNKAYGMEIEDKLTVYDACAHHLIPKENEPNA